VDKCPVGALRIELNPIYKSLGDFRWTADLILSTWHMAETGHAPDGELECEIGNSGGGFDRMRFKSLKAGRGPTFEINTAIAQPPQRRQAGDRLAARLRRGHVAYRSTAQCWQSAAAVAWNSFSCRRGGYLKSTHRIT
jgi:hypothetical protein